MSTTPRTTRRSRPRQELRQAGVSDLPVAQIRPAPENDRLYRPIDPKAPDIKALAESIRRHGIKEPLVVSLDGYILSGHRRSVAARLAGLKQVPCRIEPIRRSDDIDQFVVLLREFNRQREKSRDERLREETVTIDPAEAHRSLIDQRRWSAYLGESALTVTGQKHRCAISAAKQPFVDVIKQVLENRKAFWPLSDRAIHYGLLSNPPLRHASKPDSVYGNNRQSYEALVELLTRARLAGVIPFRAISDETRPVTTWQVHRTVGNFVSAELGGLFKGYWRDLLQSQPNHIEIVAEKNTIEPVVRPVAMEYCIPLTISRGYCSLPPRAAIAQRYKRSGKEKLVLLMLSDFDPDGEEIAHSLARSLRDDFGVTQLHAVKVALTAEQVDQYELPPVMTAKKSSTHYTKFTEQFGENVFELEALEPSILQAILREAIDSVLDVEAFNAEMETEEQDAAFLAGLRGRVLSALQGVVGED